MVKRSLNDVVNTNSSGSSSSSPGRKAMQTERASHSAMVRADTSDAIGETTQEVDAVAALHPNSSGSPRRKRRTTEPQPHRDHKPGLLMKTDELAQFQSWIDRSAVEEPPVAGAGAAKHSPDGDLRMFRDRPRVAYPPIMPLATTTSSSAFTTTAAAVPGFPSSSSSSPHRTASPPRKRKTSSIVDELLLRASETVSLPILASPSRNCTRNDKALVYQLLSDCKENGKQGIQPDGDTNNQLSSGRNSATETTETATATESLVIPDSVFYANNSFIGRAQIDLSDWACLCGTTTTTTTAAGCESLFDQMARKLTKNCEQLSLRGFTGATKPKALQQLFQHCGRVHTLDLSRCGSISKAAWPALAAQCPLLTSLSLAEMDTLTDDLLYAAVVSFPRLKSLTICHCPQITDASVIKITKILALQLERWRLDYCVHLNDHAIQSIIKSRGPALRVVSLRGLVRVSNSNIKELFMQQPKQLEELNVSGCIDLSDTCFEFLSSVPSYYGNRAPSGYHLMQRIDLSDCVKLTSLSCCFIAASCPFLMSFVAARCVSFCDKALIALASLTKLEEVDLSGCSKLTDQGMQTFLLTNGLQQTSKAIEKPSMFKPLQRLLLADCSSLGQPTIEAVARSCSSTLKVLDASGIAVCPSSVFVKLVKHCRGLEQLLCRCQRGVTRAALAHLATCNSVLHVLDIRECPAVDDLALYPLAVMRSLKELLVSGSLSGGSSALTTQGLLNLPSSLTHLALIGFAKDQLDDASCCDRLFDVGRLRQLETLDLSQCIGLSIHAIRHILSVCQYLRAVNVDRCDQIKTAQIARALRDDSTMRPFGGSDKSNSTSTRAMALQPRCERYGVDVIDDSSARFRGLAAVDAEASQRARHRETLLVEDAARHRAAASIQWRFRSRARALWKEQRQKAHDWQVHCAAVDIQRVVRGFACRQYVAFLREQLTRAVTVLQYKWRQRLAQRRIRKATSYWTNRMVLKTFALWKHDYLVAKQSREQDAASQKAAKALHFWGDKTLDKVFHGWRAYVAKRTVKAKKAIGFWKCQSLPRVFDAWIKWTRATKRHRELLIAVFLNIVELESHNSTRQLANAAKANPKTKRVVWKRWLEFVIDQKRFLLKASLSILSGNMTHWAFRQWRQNILEQRVLRDKHRRLVHKMFHRDLHRSWLAWHDFMETQKSKKRAFLKFSNSAQTKCWQKWKMFHFQTQKLKNVSSKIATRLTQQQLVRAVGLWYEFTQIQVETRQKQRRAMAFFLNASLLRTFTAWAGFASFVVSLRCKWRARLANANVTYALNMWIDYRNERRVLHKKATLIQAFWRGFATRRHCEDEFFYRVWAANLIQNAWRGRLARAILRIAGRKKRLNEYIRAEKEQDAMHKEELQMRKYTHELELIVALQRMWRGVAARALFIEVRRAKFISQKQQQIEQQEIVRALARQKQLDRDKQKQIRHLAAITIQKQIRGFLARRDFQEQKEFLRKQRYVVRVQAVYRGRMSRRRTAALRRSYLTRMEILTRRAVEGKMLRSLGAQTRQMQRPLRSFLAFFGLDPATFLTDIRAVFQEVKQDFTTMKQFFEAVRSRVTANAAATKALATAAATTTGEDGKMGLLNLKSPKNMLKKSQSARKFLHELEQIISSTAQDQQKKDEKIRVGDAVRIVVRGHPRCGETAFVLTINDEIAQIKLDVDGELEFFPLFLPATKVELAKRTLQKIPDLAFHASSLGKKNHELTEKWRFQLEMYAKSIEKEAKRFNAARVIQCACRVYLARMKIQRELEMQGIHAARRQQALVRMLQTFKLANKRMASVLVQLHMVRPLHMPPPLSGRGSALSEEPLKIQKIVNKFQRAMARRAEIHQAMLRLVPEEFKDINSGFYGGVMQVPPSRIIDKLLLYPFQYVKRVTRVPFAQFLAKKGNFELANFFGGVEFIKTFEEQNIDAKEFVFDQLKNCSFCGSEGVAIVHGVFAKRPMTSDTNYINENRVKKSKKKQLKKVPHGYGVAHFLTGISTKKNKQINWLERNSIEAQFKSLQVVKEMKYQEKQERLQTQILARQGTLNTLRSKEGARGYAKRHSELSLLEEKTLDLYQQYQDEIIRRQKQEILLFEEEHQIHDLIQKECQELEKQGQKLHELQQQIPEVVTEVALLKPVKTPLEFLHVGGFLEVEYDDEQYYHCEILQLDVYDLMVAEVLFVDDQRKEKLKLVQASVFEDHRAFQLQQEEKKTTKKTPKSVAQITADAHAKQAEKQIPFRKWKAGKAIDILWDAPPDNGAVITQYVVEWKDDKDETLTGKSFVTRGSSEDASAASGAAGEAEEAGEGAPTTTTLWPIPPQCEQTLRVRVAAENRKGIGLASVYVSLPMELLVDVSYLTATPLIRPQKNTTKMEKNEQKELEKQENLSWVLHRELTCTFCDKKGFPSAEKVHDHIARTHSVPLLCPFKSCHQVCASEKALRYHIWKCSIAKPTLEELKSDLFMEIFNVSRQYCLRKDLRHVGRLHQAVADIGSDLDSVKKSHELAEEMFLEAKYQDACLKWIAKAREIHDQKLFENDRDRQREKDSHYLPPKPLFGLDFSDPELNFARRESVLATKNMIQADLDAFRLETSTQLDKLRHEEKELKEYISLKVKRMKNTQEEWQKQSLKREKKKAQKNLNAVETTITQLIASSTLRITEMTIEIARLDGIEKAFVPFTHQVVRLNRLAQVSKNTFFKTQEVLKMHQIILQNYHQDLRKLMQNAMNQVDQLNAFEEMMEARKRQLLALEKELHQLQMIHVAEVESMRQKRDLGDENFQLTKLRSSQNAVFTRRDLATQALLALSKKQSKGDAQRTRAALVAAEETEIGHEIVVSGVSLQIANHDLQLHEKFIKGKSSEAAYLKDDEVKEGEDGGGQGDGHRALLEIVETEAGGARGGGAVQGGGQATTEGSSPQAEVLFEDETSSAIKPKKKRQRPLLRELPHSYVRLECCFQDGEIRGHVRIEYNDGSVYEGPWVEDVSYEKRVDAEPFKTKHSKNHYGKFSFAQDGSGWEGEDVDNYFSPLTATGPQFKVTKKGHQDSGPSTIYMGNIRNGKYHGFGTLEMQNTVSKGEYHGEWLEGKRHGYGIERFDTGELYEGYWQLDLYHGHGEMLYDDGSKYEGYFQNGKWHGNGKRILASGDLICGFFENGYLNGPGMMSFMDKRHYSGNFRQTRRHGFGALTFSNGDRYEGEFENDCMHGNGKWISKQANGEPLVRLGKWEQGERIAWLSKPSSQLATRTFLEYFAQISNIQGEIEMDLIIPKFKTPYAVMVAGMLPNLPEGVDTSDVFVQSIVKLLAKTQNVMVGVDVLAQTMELHTKATQKVEILQSEYENLRNEMDMLERDLRAKQKKVNELDTNFHEKCQKEQEMQIKIENFWKFHDPQNLESKYKQAVEKLHACEVMDWYNLRTANLDDVYLSLLEAFAILLNFTSNLYLSGQMYRPSKDDLVMLLSSNEENVHFGDKEGLIHKYQVKALYVLPLFDVYSFGNGIRQQMLYSITSVIYHPKLRPNNFKLYQISPAFTAICGWVRAAFFYAKKAMEICPVVERVLEQLVIVEHFRDLLKQEQIEKMEMENIVATQRMILENKKIQVDENVEIQKKLEKTIMEIEQLEANEQIPMEKKHIKKPQTYRPASASINAAKEEEEDEEGEDGGEDKEAKKKLKKEKAKQAAALAAAEAQINRRQLFEEDHSESTVATGGEGGAEPPPPKQPQKLQKEQKLAEILSNPDLFHEFELLKKEVHKVIDRCGGKIAVVDFPVQFEEIMLKKLDPMAFGIKKMRTLLSLMDDICVFVEPQREGDFETLQFPIEADEEPMAPRQKYFCRLCPGISYESQEELRFHEKTKWHFWNGEAKRQGNPVVKYTLAASYWSEAYDSSDNRICYHNKMTGQVVKSDEPPMEMQANELMMELLVEEGVQGGGRGQGEEGGEEMVVETAAEEEEGEDPWEEVADDAGNVYFYNHETGESSWTKPLAGDVTVEAAEAEAAASAAIE